MSQARTFGRWTSVAMIAALVAVTVLMTCGVAFGAPMSSSTTPCSSTCAVGSHDSLGTAAVSAESPRISPALSAVLPMSVHPGIPQGFGSQNAASSAELFPAPDPRHGRIRV